MGQHKFECSSCHHVFYPDINKYNTDPSARRCIKCKSKPVMYHGHLIGPMNIISDDFGVKGLYSHADGKMYDSKSAYKKAVKAQGYEIAGEGIKPSKPVTTDIDWKGAVAETMNKMGY